MNKIVLMLIKFLLEMFSTFSEHTSYTLVHAECWIQVQPLPRTVLLQGAMMVPSFYCPLNFILFYIPSVSWMEVLSSGANTK